MRQWRTVALPVERRHTPKAKTKKGKIERERERELCTGGQRERGGEGTGNPGCKAGLPIGVVPSTRFDLVYTAGRTTCSGISVESVEPRERRLPVKELARPCT